MRTLYLMRHGETFFNRRRMVQGWCDSPLTERGRSQAKQARDWLAERGVDFDVACSSTAERACDTLEIVAPNMDYRRDRRLKEFHYGVLEGGSYEAVLPGTYAPYGDFLVPFGGEAEADVAARMCAALDELMRDERVGNALAVSHGACTRAFAASVCGGGAGDAAARRGIDRVAANGAVYVYDYADGAFALRELFEPVATD